MVKFLVLFHAIILFVPVQVNNFEYDLINHVLNSKGITTVNENFYVTQDRFQSYGEISLAFSADLLDPTKSIDLDSLFSSQQKIEFEEKLKGDKPNLIDANKISSSIEVRISENYSNFQISYPIIQKGIDDMIYGILFENSPSFESGGRSIKLYRLDGENWLLLHESLVAIS